MLIIGENSYLDLDAANEFVDELYFEDSEENLLWKSLSDTNKEKLILGATSKIDQCMFRGRKMYPESRLNWPRVINDSYFECPNSIKMAIIKQGIQELIYKKTDEYKFISKGVKSYTVKNSSVVFSDNYNVFLKTGIFIDVYKEYIERWTL